MRETPAEARFRDCGFDWRLIQALIAAGYDHPRKLLSASRDEIELIVGVGKKGLEKIEANRARYGIPPRR